MWTGQYLVTESLDACVELNSWREAYGFDLGCDIAARNIFKKPGYLAEDVEEMACRVMKAMTAGSPWVDLDPYDPRRMLLFSKRHRGKVLRIWDEKSDENDFISDAILLREEERRPTQREMLAIDRRCTYCLVPSQRAAEKCASAHRSLYADD